VTQGDDAAVQEVIVGMDKDVNDELGAPGGHTTRTLAFDSAGKWLYVSIGSLGNVDLDSFRARIRRFDISAWDGQTPLEFNEGEVFADGLRNEVGLAFDSHGDLWGVENGADRLYREDLGGSIVNDNPGEELNRFTENLAGEHWGYPYCWSEYCLSVDDGGSGVKGGNNTVWAWPSFIDAGYTDEWCRKNTQQSVLSMPAHSAPLGMTFYKWNDVSPQEYADLGCNGGFPKGMDKYAFIAYHGSWNRSPPTGYKVVYIPFDAEGNPANMPIDLLRHGGSTAKWSNGDIRPVDVQFDSCGHLYVTEDGTGSVIKITYDGDYFDENYEPSETSVADGATCSEAYRSQSPTSSPSRSTTSSISTTPPTESPTISMSSPPVTSPTLFPSPRSTGFPTLSPSSGPSHFSTSIPNDGSSATTSTMNPTANPTLSDTMSPVASLSTSTPFPTSRPTSTPNAIFTDEGSNDQIELFASIPTYEPTPQDEQALINEVLNSNNSPPSETRTWRLQISFVFVLFSLMFMF